MLLFQIQKKLQELFSKEITPCYLNILFTSPVSVKSFFIVKAFSSYFRYYIEDMRTNIKVLAVMSPIMLKPNIILKSRFKII